MIVLGNADSAFVSFNPSFFILSGESLKKYEAKFGKRVDYFIYIQINTRYNLFPPASICLENTKF